MKEEKIKEMAGVLVGGGKMLSIPCPKCGSPLFQQKDKIICLSCKKEIIEESKAVVGYSPDKLKSIVQKKLGEVCVLLEKERNIENAKKMLDFIEVCLRILKELK